VLAGGDSQLEWRQYMMYRMALPLMALVVAGGCSGSDATEPVSADGVSSANKAVSGLASSSPRSGSIHVEKECSAYAGGVGDICTITKSNVKEIEVGSTIHYLVAADLENLTYDGPVVLDPPGPGNNTAAGHCTVNLAAGTGVCAYSGGTGKFTWFHADIDVTPLGGVNYAWNGTYSFGP
jgi:hypothetical protein